MLSRFRTFPKKKLTRYGRKRLWHNPATVPVLWRNCVKPQNTLTKEADIRNGRLPNSIPDSYRYHNVLCEISYFQRRHKHIKIHNHNNYFYDTLYSLLLCIQMHETAQNRDSEKFKQTPVLTLSLYFVWKLSVCLSTIPAQGTLRSCITHSSYSCRNR